MGLTQTKNGMKQSSSTGDKTFEEAMGSFAAEAESTKVKLEKRIKSMEHSFKDLCSFLGEAPPPKTKSDELFKTISRFVEQFKLATTQYKEKSARKAKAAQRDAERAAMKSKIKASMKDTDSHQSLPKSSVSSTPTARPPVPVPPGVRGPPRGLARGAPRPPPGVQAPGTVAPGVPRPRGEWYRIIFPKHFICSCV